MFVGPLPPPLHGFSNVCANMLCLLKVDSQVEVFDRAPRMGHGVASILRKSLKLGRFFSLAMRHPQCRLYLALSGGLGQFFDWPYVLICKVFGRRLFIHHHSFAYINAPALYNKALFSMVRHETHIVLSPGMGAALATAYKIDAINIRVISNAAFFSREMSVSSAESRRNPAIHLGFIANITVEKGFIEFFAVLERLTNLGIPYRAQIGGPVDTTAREKFAELLASSPEATHLGAVYGKSKEKFYDQLDVLLFPTHYVNEAEPLVIHEALSHGVYVIATDRGAIPELLHNGAGATLTEARFVEDAVTLIDRLSKDPESLCRARSASFFESQRLNREARSALKAVLTEITGMPQARDNGNPKNDHGNKFADVKAPTLGN